MAPCGLLDADYIKQAEYRARRFSGAYTGTSGTLAADVMRLLNERAAMAETIAELETANAALRAAVENRLGGSAEDNVEPTAIDDPGAAAIPIDWILQGERELRQDEQRFTGDGVMRSQVERDGVSPSERLLLDAAAAVRDRRQKYGPPSDHFSITAALVNAAFGTTFTAMDWATCMMLDKIARSRGPVDHPDNDIDAAGYAACRAECRAP